MTPKFKAGDIIIMRHTNRVYMIDSFFISQLDKMTKYYRFRISPDLPGLLSGSPVALSGSPVALSGSPVALSGSPVALSGSPVALSGSSVAYVDDEAVLYDSPKGTV